MYEISESIFVILMLFSRKVIEKWLKVAFGHKNVIKDGFIKILV